MTKRKTPSRSELARELIKQGKLSVNAIANRTGLSKQTIYTVKWKMANKQGLGAIKPKTPAVGKGTGIASSAPRAVVPLEFEIIDRKPKQSNKRRNAQLARRQRERMENLRKQSEPIFSVHVKGRLPKLSLWQRIKEFFVGA